MKRDADKTKHDLTDGFKRPPERRTKTQDLLSCGYAPLNIAVSGHVRGAFAPGKYYHLFGKSDSGKTFLSMSCFAEASINPRFKEHRLIADPAEDGMEDLLQKTEMFGPHIQKRIEPPRGTQRKPRPSRTVEEFYYNMDDAFKAGRPFLYVLDSMDALTSKQDQRKFDEHKKASRRTEQTGKDEKEAGSYGMAKAKTNASGMRVVFNKLAESDSILIIISQAKANVGFGFEEDTFSGGTALKFYAHAQLHTSLLKTVGKKIGKKTHDQGIVALVRVRKNRHTGRKTSAKVPIYWATGIDDTGGCVDYLVENGWWGKSNGVIDAKELEVKMRREDLIQHVEDNDMEMDLHVAVEDQYEKIRLALIPKRKRRYD